MGRNVAELLPSRAPRRARGSTYYPLRFTVVRERLALTQWLRGRALVRLYFHRLRPRLPCRPLRPALRFSHIFRLPSSDSSSPAGGKQIAAPPQMRLDFGAPGLYPESVRPTRYGIGAPTVPPVGVSGAIIADLEVFCRRRGRCLLWINS